jgi:hypothetical protein
VERIFHVHFYSPQNELKLSDLTLIRQSHDESVNDYIWRFRDTKNRCFNLPISEKDMANLGPLQGRQGGHSTKRSSAK